MEKITSLLYHYTSSDPHNSNPNPTIYAPFLLSLSFSLTDLFSVFILSFLFFSLPFFFYTIFSLYPSSPFGLFFSRRLPNSLLGDVWFPNFLPSKSHFCSTTQLL